MRNVTLGFLIKETKQGKQICLAMKKRGFGEGKWNGSGGKFDEQKDKSILGALKREMKEEIGVDISKTKKVGYLIFQFDGKPEWEQKVHLYITKEWKGTPSESEEMKPKWFKYENIPYESMWEDDHIWLPFVLDNKNVKGKFIFDKDSRIRKFNLTIL